MKNLVLILSLMLTACVPGSFSNCSKLEHLPYKFNDRVTVVSGFYEGQLGRVVHRSWIYNPNSCNSLAFTIRLDNLDKEVDVEQNNLKKTK